MVDLFVSWSTNNGFLAGGGVQCFCVCVCVCNIPSDLFLLVGPSLLTWYTAVCVCVCGGVLVSTGGLVL